MNTRIRLTRNPLTAIFWMLLTTVMALLLGVGSSLMYASGSMSGIMDDHHTSIAVRTDAGRQDVETSYGTGFKVEEKSFTQEDLDYFMSLPSVEGVYFHTLSAAYSPSFRPLLPVQQNSDEGQCYGDVVLVAELTKIAGLEQDGLSTAYCIVTVEEFLYQNHNHTRRESDTGGDPLILRLYISSQEAGDNLQEGQRYLIATHYTPFPSGTLLSNGTLLPNYHQLDSIYSVKLAGDMLVVDLSGYTGIQGQEGGTTPVMVRLDGSVEEFLADPEQEHWVSYIDALWRQGHSLPVIGTEALDTFHAFVNYDATMTQGRFFTQEEYDTGARVCILSEELAQSSGIALGDTITLSQYLCHLTDINGFANGTVDTKPYDGKLNNPTVGNLGFRDYDPEESFTVVGLYRLRNQWADTSYSFTPNTVFIPRKAQISGAFGGMSGEPVTVTQTTPEGHTFDVTVPNLGGVFGIYFTMKLKNGMVTDFETMLEATPYAGQFLTLDQGFDAVQKTLDAVAASTRPLFLAVVAGWLLMAALYVLLYQGRQKRNVGIMRSLGATPTQTQNYLWGSGMVVCGLGIAIGTLVTTLTMDLVQDKLLDATFGVEANRYSVAGLSDDAINLMVTESQLPLWAAVALGAAQIALLALILYLQARALSRKSPGKLMEK